MRSSNYCLVTIRLNCVVSKSKYYIQIFIDVSLFHKAKIRVQHDSKHCLDFSGSECSYKIDSECSYKIDSYKMACIIVYYVLARGEPKLDVRGHSMFLNNHFP